MMAVQSTQRFLVIHKPDKANPPEYFGPFVSERIAEEFVATTLNEGKSWIKPLHSRQYAEH